jgi:hypothetical protein
MTVKIQKEIDAQEENDYPGRLPDVGQPFGLEPSRAKPTPESESSLQNIRSYQNLLTADYCLLNSDPQVLEVTIIKPGPTKHEFPDYTISYTEQALEKSLPLWNGAACFCDHLNKSVKNIVGVFYDPSYDNGVKAKLRFLDSNLYNFICQFIQDRDQGLAVPDIGISADVGIKTIDTDHHYDVIEINRVLSADIVFSPAAGGSFDRILNEIGSSEPLSLGEGDNLIQKYEKRIRDFQSQNDKFRNQINDITSEKQVLLSQYDDLRKEHQQALLALKEALLKANPAIPEELLNSSTLAELETSFQNAEQVVQKITDVILTSRGVQLNAPTEELQIPAGSPIRAEPDFESLSPREKIKQGIQRR